MEADRAVKRATRAGHWAVAGLARSSPSGSTHRRLMDALLNNVLENFKST